MVGFLLQIFLQRGKGRVRAQRGKRRVPQGADGVLRGETQAARGVSSQLHPGDLRLQPVEKRVPVENRRAAQ